MPPAAAPISAPFQPPARAPMPAPTAAPPPAPTAVLSPGAAPAASVAALVLEIWQVRRGHAHAEAAHHADHESEPDGRGAVLVEEARRRIREALRALEGVDGHFVEERN